ncbi:hypothetical protein [Streptomyces kaniharaensis]|nr:hypothetical protein [Streptomyces kaniharaensis]
MMRNSELGDINVGTLSDELLLWARTGEDYPRPGAAGWPAPDGPYLD